jgi:hypothetical protein
MTAVEEHSRQLAHLFQAKADLAAINNLLSEKEPHILAAPLPQTAANGTTDPEELKQIKDNLAKKVSK